MGFMEELNRVNVAMSRAKHGLVIVGNADFLESQAEVFRSIIKLSKFFSVFYPSLDNALDFLKTHQPQDQTPFNPEDDFM